jgi:hypothetical protein
LCKNFLFKWTIEGKIRDRIEVMGSWGWGHKQILDSLMEIRGYWKLKEEALDHTVWTAHFGWCFMACHKTDCRINECVLYRNPCKVGPCHHSKVRSHVADGGMTSKWRTAANILYQ